MDFYDIGPVMDMLCPCGSELAFGQCCGPLLSGDHDAVTAEALMRSRYSAFVRGDMDYLERTNSGEAAELFNRAEIEAQMPDTEWLRLDIRSTYDGGVDDATGMVVFEASYIYKGQIYKMVEASGFVRVDGKWRYDHGRYEEVPQPHISDKVGRNEPCPCGSGKKYKKCCGK